MMEKMYRTVASVDRESDVNDANRLGPGEDRIL